MAANIALTTADRVEIVAMWQPLHLIAGEAITAGAPVAINTSGKAVNADGATSGVNGVVGIATRTVASGGALTVMKAGIMDGFVFTTAYGAGVFVSDTSGRLYDVAGTVSLQVGYISAGNATTIGTAADKLLVVNL